ncbi:MAG: D-glycerate dehydrogenase [Anaerolineales bacterium]|nr:D-glycerate dehydrogenase [Anaerolineales bacterium]
MPEELPLVLISHSLPAGWLESLQGRCRTLVGPDITTRLAPELEAQLGQAAGLFCLLTIRVDEALLERAARLRVVSNMAVGVDNIDLQACTRRGIPVGNTPGVLTEGTADLAMTLLLAAARRLVEASDVARRGLWESWAPAGWLGMDLNGATLGIVGLGKIGRAVAQRARGFDLRIVYHDPQRDAEAEASLGLAYLPLTELLQHSDFISLHTPLTPETRGLINARTLRQMKPNAILVNTSRGPVVNTGDLVTALRQGWIAAAALDVTDPEPLPADHPLNSLPNCLVTPHIGSATHNTRRRMAELACENLLAGLAGKRLPHCANPQVYET